jgi:hypothetical protein
MNRKLFNVYSSMLGGFIAMGFETEDEAKNWIVNHLDLSLNWIIKKKGK